MVAALIAALIAPASATGTSVKQVALTFDDGDNERHIRQAVAVAVATQTPITFFPTGKSLRRFPNLWKAIGDAGIPIANHTVTHPNLKTRYAAKGLRITPSPTRISRRAMPQKVQLVSGLSFKDSST